MSICEFCSHTIQLKEVDQMYRTTKSIITDEDGNSHLTYGISYEERSFNDISTDKSKIERLVMLCNEQKLSPIHLKDVIEDFLVDFQI